MTRLLLAGLLIAAVAACGGSSERPGEPPFPGRARATAPVQVPNLIGMRGSEAVCALQRARLRWRFAGDHETFSRSRIGCELDPKQRIIHPDPKVIALTPVPGQQVRAGGVVVIEQPCVELFPTNPGCP